MNKKEIRDYVITQKLGTGSYGVVYLVHKNTINSPSKHNKHSFMNAIKNENEIFVLKQISLFGLSKKEIEEVKVEAKLLASINSKYVVRYIESFIEENNLYIIMEYCEGGDLSMFIKNQKGKPLTDFQIWSIFIQSCLGLYYLHMQKILHRDIKSLNIFMNKQGNVKLGDLGVAKVLSTSFANTFVGTPYYLSPEMCEEKPYNEKSDVWALGCIFYELVTFKHPFNAMNQGALIIKIIRGKYDPLPLNTNSDIKKIIELILEKNSLKRPFVTEILKNPILISKAKQYNLYDDIVDTGLIQQQKSNDKKDNTEQIQQLQQNNYVVNNKGIKSKSGFNYHFQQKSKEKVVLKSNEKIRKENTPSYDKRSFISNNNFIIDSNNKRDINVKKSSSELKDFNINNMQKVKVLKQEQSSSNINSKLKLNIPSKYIESNKSKQNKYMSLVSQIMGVETLNLNTDNIKFESNDKKQDQPKINNKKDPIQNQRPLFKESSYSETPSNILDDPFAPEVNIIIKEKENKSSDYLELVKPKKITKKRKKTKNITNEEKGILYFQEDKFEDGSILITESDINDKPMKRSIFDNMLKSIKDHSELQNKMTNPDLILNIFNKDKTSSPESNDDYNFEKYDKASTSKSKQYEKFDEIEDNNMKQETIITNNSDLPALINEEIIEALVYDVKEETIKNEIIDIIEEKIISNQLKNNSYENTKEGSINFYIEENFSIHSNKSQNKNNRSYESNFTNNSKNSFKVEVSYCVEHSMILNPGINVFQSMIPQLKQQHSDIEDEEETVNITKYANLNKKKLDKAHNHNQRIGQILKQLENEYTKVEDFLIFYNTNKDSDDVLDKLDAFIDERIEEDNNKKERIRVLMKKYIISDISSYLINESE